MYTVIVVIKSIHANKGMKLYIVYSINLVTQAWISFDQNNMIKLSFVGYSDERLAYIIIAFRWRCSRSNTEASKHLKLCTKKVEPSKDKLVKWAFFPFPLWIDKNTCFAFLVHSTSTFHCNPSSMHSPAWFNICAQLGVGIHDCCLIYSAPGWADSEW